MQYTPEADDGKDPVAEGKDKALKKKEKEYGAGKKY